MPSCQVAHPSVVIIDQPPVPKPTQAPETRKPFQFMVTDRHRKPWTSASGCCWCLKLPFKRSTIRQPRGDLNFSSIFHNPDEQCYSCIKFYSVFILYATSYASIYSFGIRSSPIVYSVREGFFKTSS